MATATQKDIRSALRAYIQGTFVVDMIGPKRARVFIASSAIRPAYLPQSIQGVTIVYKSPPTPVGGRNPRTKRAAPARPRTTGSFPQFQAAHYGPRPSPLELMVLGIVQRWLSGLFSTSRAHVLWDATLHRNVVAYPYDRAAYLRFPTIYMGVPIRSYTPDPSLARRSATIIDGVPKLAVNDGVGIGWPAITTSLVGPGNGSLVTKEPAGTSAAMLPAFTAVRRGCPSQQ